jgi:dihydroanticapsin dehydrogenase
MRLKHKVAIITGAGSGIGLATAQLFASEGAKVVVVDIEKASGSHAVQLIAQSGGQAVFVEADISSETAAKRIAQEAIATFEGIDILVNNAAAFVLKGFEATVEEWRRSWNVNVLGTVLCTKYAVDAMKKTGGAIVNLGSISSVIAEADMFAYSATKGAILQMTRNMAMDLAQFGIRVNCVCPGPILTPASLQHMEKIGLSTEQFKATEGSKTLLNRVGDPREVASAILFLASHEASYITGASLMVDGGYTTV